MATFSGARANTSMNDWVTMLHTKTGTRLSDMPGARMVSAVTMTLTDPAVLDSDSSSSARQ